VTGLPAPKVLRAIEIVPPHGLPKLGLGELWRHRQLLGVLTWREISVRYKQTLLGFGWAILQPVAMAVIFSIVVGRWLAGPSADLPYFVFALSGLVAWQLFTHGVSGASASMVTNERLVTRVYIPRLALPLAAVLSGVADFVASLLVLLGVMAWTGHFPGIRTVLVPLVVCWTLLASAGAGILLAALNVRYRDVRHAVPFLSQIWLFATPVLYSFDAVAPAVRPWLALNPMVGVVEAFRWALLGAAAPEPATVIVSLLATAALFIGGVGYFRWAEREFADVI
jgi:lipopolysaccharide transport system permease protein